MPDFDYVEGNDLRSTKNGVDTLTIAIWALLRAKDVESCLVPIINLGGDTDTAAAVGGAFAGARFGPQDIPKNWVNRLREKGAILQAAKKLNRLVESDRVAVAASLPAREPETPETPPTIEVPAGERENEDTEAADLGAPQPEGARNTNEERDRSTAEPRKRPPLRETDSGPAGETDPELEEGGAMLA